MKKTIFLFTFFVQFISSAQTYLFQYDAAGNQVERYINYSGRMAQGLTTTTNETKVLKEYDEFKYYPNPVKEELYLEWTNVEDKSVIEIQLYDIQGKIMFQKKTINEITTSIPFQSLAKGMYYLQIQYSNNTQKSIKILKD